MVKQGVDPPTFLKCFFTEDQSLLEFKVTVSGCAVLWGYSTETNRVALLEEEHTVLQILGSPKEARHLLERGRGEGAVSVLPS